MNLQLKPRPSLPPNPTCAQVVDVDVTMDDEEDVADELSLSQQSAAARECIGFVKPIAPRSPEAEPESVLDGSSKALDAHICKIEK